MREKRVLEFVAEKQLLQKKNGCDFSNIAPGTSGYLAAKFTFSDEWAGCRKAASFWYNGKEHGVLLDDHDSCEIPPEALPGGKFEVSVIGVSEDGYRITSTRTTVYQEVY